MIHPWSRQRKEPPRNFAQFQRYRDLGPARSVSKVAALLEITSRSGVRRLEETCSRWKWVERSAAWDDHLDEELQRSNKEAIAAMHNRHLLVSEAIIVKLAKKIAKMQPEEVRSSDIAALLKVATSLERSARGEATSIIEVRQRKSTRPLLPSSIDEDSFLRMIEAVQEKGALPGETGDPSPDPAQA